MSELGITLAICAVALGSFRGDRTEAILVVVVAICAIGAASLGAYGV